MVRARSASSDRDSRRAYGGPLRPPPEVNVARVLGHAQEVALAPVADASLLAVIRTRYGHLLARARRGLDELREYVVSGKGEAAHALDDPLVMVELEERLVGYERTLAFLESIAPSPVGTDAAGALPHGGGGRPRAPSSDGLAVHPELGPDMQLQAEAARQRHVAEQILRDELMHSPSRGELPLPPATAASPRSQLLGSHDTGDGDDGSGLREVASASAVAQSDDDDDVDLEQLLEGSRGEQDDHLAAMREMAAEMKAQSLATRSAIRADLQRLENVDTQVDAALAATDKLNARVSSITSSLLSCSSMTCVMVLFVVAAFMGVFWVVKLFPK
ncbi:uncharacterized protein AMSG_02361 [Thecamonas trahens ATCC 50062]|uniref:Uncharacterized protein n=1 Tax=Thecamonas trahens ATCC 50062 TaxID=461836 RepID=A0A0L0DW43_THETB|nr:hypothetical protein AMSG_02361 [Thecamonas trahens ATCC 50062]KNC56392.1 hypothetical protein AMSG_02361 [Thecamonas trahens ATCC 50062]|eukprot:XP_013760906.1 hypothetical protein AMSG_02361 [Thecamonas trahens ATCC 50062]